MGKKGAGDAVSRKNKMGKNREGAFECGEGGHTRERETEDEVFD